MSTSPYLLRVDEHGLLACHIDKRGNALAPACRFAAGDVAGFAAWLARQPGGCRCRLVFDLAGEQIEVESLPRARGADRRALLARRLAAHFGRSPVAWTHALGRKTDSPHQEDVVLHGLTSSGALQPWLDVLKDKGARLEALASATSLTAHFAPRALRLDGNLLLVCLGRNGMRLSQVERGVAHFTRLVGHLHALDDEALHEISRTRTYLGTRPRAGEAGLQVVVLDGVAARDPVPDPADGIRRIAAVSLFPDGPGPIAPDADLIEAAHLRWLAQMPRSLSFGTSSSQVSRAGGALPRLLPHATALATTAALAFAAMRWADAAALEREAAAVEARIASQRAELSRFKDARAALPAKAEELLAVIAHIEREQARQLPPAALFARLGAALDAVSGLELDQLSWSPPPEGAPGATITMNLRPADDLDSTSLAETDAAVEALAQALAQRGGRAFERASPAPAGNDGYEGGGRRPPTATLRFRFDAEEKQ